MRKKISAILVVLICIVVISGCAHISGGVAPSTIPLTPGSYKELGEVQGTDCIYALLGMIPLSGGNETRNAVKNALEEASGATALINVSADTYSQFFILVSRTCTQIHGTAVALK